MSNACRYVQSLQAAPTIFFLGIVLMITLLYAGNFNSSPEEPPRALMGLKRPPRIRLNATDGCGPLVQSICFLGDPSPVLEQFVDRLPILPTIDISDGSPVVMGTFKILKKVHRDLPPTTMYAYGTSRRKARSPGPVLLAKRNIATYVRWENHIADEKHFLAVDDTVTSAVPRRGGVPTVTHLHGMEVESKYDGHPESWFTRHGDTGPKYVTQNYMYPNSILPALVWYHDHTVGMTRLNVIAGLSGPYLVRGAPSEEPIGLPSGDHEIVLFLQDKQFFANGSINFPSVGDDTSLHPNWCPGYFGDTILVNGKVWPYLEVLPFKYRLRILNGASERYFRLSLDRANMTFQKIGTDGGYLHTPETLDELILAPAERVDCIVDFRGLAQGTKVILNNSAPTPFPGGPEFPPFDPTAATTAVLQFRVGTTLMPDPSNVPAILGKELRVLELKNNTVLRRFTLSETINNVGNNTQVLLSNMTWEDPPTEFPVLGSTEVWQFISLTPSIAHPIHIHLIKFQVLSVQPMNTSSYSNQTCSIEISYGNPDSCFLGPSRGPNAHEIGWKDLVSAEPNSISRIVMKFTSQDGTDFRFDPSVGPGYLWHCHLLSHEDNSMMRPLHIKK